ncbi:MAG: hypothetical protein GEV04_01470 [Actinophytocola sp.]|nr:hypothetical protein [Actinophytocola sp.]
MMINLTPVEALAAVGVLLALILVWRAGSRRARRAADVAQASARVVSLAGRVIASGGAMLGVQWLVITHTDNLTLLLILLAAPDVIAAHVITRALTVTELGTTRRRGDRR